MNAREASLSALCEVDEGINLKDALGKILEKDELNEEDRALANELAFGTLRHREEIDQIVRETYTGDFNGLDLIIKNVLRVAVYQYLFLDRIPVYAVVNEAVNLGRTIKEKSLINAVLRGIIRNRKVQSLREPKVYVLQKIIEAYPVEADKIIDSFKIRPTPFIRINTLKAKIDEVEEKLRDIGLEFTPANWYNEFKAVNRLGSIINDPVMKNGYISIHDEAQGLICHMVDPKPGETIVDLCSAPGSKSTYLAELMKNTGMIISVEVSTERLNLVIENMNRLGIAIMRPLLADGRHYKVDGVDKVLVDSPCSNSGVIAKRPEVKDRVNAKVIKRLAQLQFDLLDNAATFLKPGGCLIYSTCSILPAENEEVIEQFLKYHPEFLVEPASVFTSINNVYLKVLPGEYNTDGVFAARLRKND
jgi:16S rRNA (cytosine967-C5)-methyltransferase